MSDEEPVPYKGTKKSNKGCHRRKGVPHDLEIIQANHYSHRNVCGWARYGVTGGRTITFKKYWICRHQKSCKKCGKIVEWALKDRTECPEWLDNNPPTP